MLERTKQSDSVDVPMSQTGYGLPSFRAMNTGRILLVDDQPARRRALHTALLDLGFEIAEASGGEEAAAVCRIIRCDAILVAVSNSAERGIATCADLRRVMSSTPILAMTGDDDEQHKVEALEGGADDCVTPSHMLELTARLRAAIRRSRATSDRDLEHVVIGEIAIWPSERIVMKGEKPVHLTPHEFDLLHGLMAHAGMPLGHARLLRAVWGAESANQVEYLRTYMRQLRRKLEDDPAHPRYLLTISHIGYRFVSPAAMPSSNF